MHHNLISLDPGKLPELRCQLLIIGSGIAGLSAALEAADAGARVILVAKDKLAETATYYAQGGIAAALADEDTAAAHAADTVLVGQGLCDEKAVEVLTREGQDAVRALIERGIDFDKRDGKLHFTREAAHSHRRILHGNGDATGRLLEEFLIRQIKDNPNVTVYENHFAIDLLTADNQCHGAVIMDNEFGRMLAVRADATLLATGGAGRVFRETTNPMVSTGDGFALAYRAGAVLRDMEMTQFHPTTLYLAGAPRFLISESVRGEGARLINEKGEHFMEKYDQRADLAPRDVVSRSIARELESMQSVEIFLDLRHLPAELVRERFPNIGKLCVSYGIDIVKDLIPVRPAAHYIMGGVKVDLDGQSSVSRLFAIGETSSTGVHGANRLASNSLLEGLVFGKRAVRKALSCEPARWQKILLEHPKSRRNALLDMADMRTSLKSLTWRNLGIFRSEEPLKAAEKAIGQWERYVRGEQSQTRAGFEVQNMLTVAKLITAGALARRESRGAHQRLDYPGEDNPPRHTEQSAAAPEAKLAE